MKNYNHLINKLLKENQNTFEEVVQTLSKENKIQDRRKMRYTPEEGKTIVQYLDAGDKEGLIEWFNRRKLET